ncbi:hypothetical protein RS9916_35232 [Synechococcus sp. RS9916]|nr:hypothetical protein RS9916_35232 [Synechococcus sp. RS9916]
MIGRERTIETEVGWADRKSDDAPSHGGSGRFIESNRDKK